jgi:hypothetical protein
MSTNSRNHRTTFHVLLFATACLSNAFAWTGSEVDFPGDGQGWDLGTTNSAKYTGPDGSTEWFRFTWTASTDDPDYNFKMVTGNNWDQDYGGNLIFPKNELALMYYQPLGDTPSKLSGGATSGKRYVFTAKNPGLANTFITVMELDNNPVTISGVSRDAGTGLITINLSGTPSPQEKVYVRYTDTAWKYSQVISAQVSGSTATATIPDMKDGRNYQWYVLTSTASPDKFHNGFATDSLTLSWNNNGGANYPISGTERISDFTINGASGGYKTTKFFINEIAGDSQTLNVSATFNAGTPPAEVEVVTNLNRRDRADTDANGDGIVDGILPPARDVAGQNDTHYYRAYPMSASGSTWTASLPVTRTGAYRATVRYRFSPTGTWFYYGDRDHAVVVSPTKTLEMTLYEINPLTAEATAANEAGRSTFVDMLSAADGDTDGFDHVSLDYFNLIQTNCLWFQPIHPTGGLGVENDPATSSPYVPGSPYATKDFFAVNPYLGSDNTQASAMAEFQNFVQKADDYTGSVGTINIMLDFVANHSAWDAVMGQGGVDLGFTGDKNQKIPSNWYSRATDYGQPATYFTNMGDKDIAVAPDRDDFGKWNDVADFHYGRYSALWRYSSDTSMIPQPHKNEDDFMDWNSLSPEVIKLWRYLGQYPIYWLQQTGHTLTNSTSGTPAQRLAADNKGIDSLRCDFGQGLPNPLWEYIINKTRSAKWNFVFMAETLDGAEPGYRSNRVFDILNENMVLQFTQAHINNESDLQTAFETRRTTYRDGSILLNITSHDEVMPDDDPWVTASRYAAVSSLHGLPMTFYGQEKGIQYYWDDTGYTHPTLGFTGAGNDRFDYHDANGNFRQDFGEPGESLSKSPTLTGFNAFELNFGKYIPHFKKWNAMTVWTTPDSARFADGMPQWYGRVNWARHNSPALKSMNQWFLSTTGAANEKIFAVAKYETAGASPAQKDVVLAFSNFLPHGSSHPAQSATYDLRGSGDALWNLLGLQNSSSRFYNVRNLASSNASANVWPTARTGSDLHANGILVSLGGGTVNPITNDGELAQFLKVVDVTPPPSSAPLANYYQIGTQGAFNWTSNAGAHDSITGWRISIGTTHGGNDLVNNLSLPGTATSYNFTGTPGLTYYATLVPVSAAGVSGTPGQSDAGAPNPLSQTTPVKLLAAAGDEDGDGQSNSAEQSAGTNPLDAASALKATAISRSGNDITVTIATVSGKTYQLETSTTLLPDSWQNAGAPVQATGASTQFPHPGGAADTKRFYRARALP